MGLIPKRPTRRQRLAAILDGLPDPPELPPEVSMIEDGRVLHGSTWMTPSDYQAAEVAEGLLPSIKGCTPAILPTLEDHRAGDAHTIS